MGYFRILIAAGLVSAATSFAAQYEAESATITEDATIATSTDASGGKYVQMRTGNISFAGVTVDKAGQYTVVIHYMNNYDDSKINLVGVGETSSQVTFEETEKGKFADVETVLALTAGENTISITKSWGWIDVDYIEVKPYEAKKFDLCNAPATAKATPSANFGKKTISGVMTGNMDAYTIGDATQHEDVQAVFKAGGKYPALVGVDLMNATGANKDDSWFQEYTEKAVDIAKSIWKKGGIPAVTWHWRPGDEVEFYVKGAHETYTEFDFTEGFVKGTTNWDTLSTVYKALAADIDRVSEIFLELQKEGVAAIFRPLHESGGNWFWWSTHTGKQFVALYQLVYERMVFKNGVNNLIWDFNPQNASKLSWTPGETYYDVLSVDIYNDANDHQSNSAAFVDFANKGGTNKILNLITACRDCNRGKGKVKLSDDAELKKQQQQLAELAEKREQLKMLMEWRTELSNLQTEEAEYIRDYWSVKSNDKNNINDYGMATVMGWLKQFQLSEILDGIDIAFAQYYKGDHKSAEKALKMVGGICYNRRKQKQEQEEDGNV